MKEVPFQFGQLSRGEKILSEIAIHLPPRFRKSDLQRIYREVGESTFQSNLESLTNKEIFIQLPEDYYEISFGISSKILRNSVLNGNFEKVSRLIKFDYLNRVPLLTDEEKFCYAKILFFRGSEEIFLNNKNKLMEDLFLRRIYKEFIQEFEPDSWANLKIHPEYKRKLSDYLLDYILSGNGYSKKHFEYLNSNLNESDSSVNENWRILQVIRGADINILPKSDTGLLWKAIIIHIPEEELKLQKKICYNDYRDFLKLFYYFLKSNSNYFNDILQFLDLILSRVEHPFKDDFYLWKEFILFLNDPNSDEKVMISLSGSSTNFWSQITKLLICKWIDLEQPAFIVNDSKFMELDWFHFQLNYYLEKKREKFKFLPLFDLYKKREEWSHRLNLLQEYLANIELSRELRLFWEISYDPESQMIKSLEPKLKEKTELGWNPVKTPNLKTLFEKQNTFPYLRGNDLVILKYAETEINDFKGTRSYKINCEDPSFLEGHNSLLFNGKPVIVENKNPELELISNSGYRLNLVPNRVVESDVIVIQISESQFHCYKYPNEVLKIYEILGEGIFEYPKESEEILFPILEKLSLFIHINSHSKDLFSGKKRKQGNFTVRGSIFNLGDKFRLDCYVQPSDSDLKQFPPSNGPVLLFDKIDDNYLIERNFSLEASSLTSFIENYSPTNYANQLSNYQFEFFDFYDCLRFLSDGGINSVSISSYDRIDFRGKVKYENIVLQIMREGELFRIDGILQLPGELSKSLIILWEVFKKKEKRYLEIEAGIYYLFEKSLESSLEEIFSILQTYKGSLFFPSKTILYLNELLSPFPLVSTDSNWSDLLDSYKKIFSIEIQNQIEDNFLRNYQKEGIEWMIRRLNSGLGICLADDMGLGKTIQTIYVLRLLKLSRPILLIAPTSLLENWITELRKYIHDKIIMNWENQSSNISEKNSIVITSYAQIQIDSSIHKLSLIPWDIIVLDEAQMIKNYRSRRFQNLTKINSKYKIALTGTPIENHPGELWSIFEFINPGLLGSKDVFRERYEIPLLSSNQSRVAGYLQKLIAPFILRRTKKDVLQDLPEKKEHIILIPLSPDERNFYENIREGALEIMKDSLIPEAQKKMQILSVLMKLRRACCHRNLIIPEGSFYSEKFFIFQSLLETLVQKGNRILIFSQFVDHLKLVESFLKQKEIHYQYLDGSTPRKKRIEAVNLFQEGNGNVFLISLRAGGFGLNLTEANSVIHLDPWWNPAVEAQASDRVYRIGQKNPVNIYKLITENTVEEKILRLHTRKQELADGVLSGINKSMNYDIEELKHLLEEGE